jgi:nitrite reductase/ring-hydroxylating ferredoxin subunit
MRDSQINVDRERLRVAPSLELAVTWRREVRAGIERIWENVFDWEHLPVLHEMYFNAVEQIEIGDWGWRVALTKNPGTPDRSMVLEMRADREKARYRVQTLSGDGAGTEIWTLLTPLAPHRTAVEVRYYLPERRPERLAALADKYRASCVRLWNEDEAMMMRREEMMTRASAERRRSEKPVPLGPSAGLRRRLPLLVEYEGEPFRIVEGEDGSLLAHATICPHWLGPLDEAAPQNGILRCPWHGYRFDMRSGESADGRGYRLAPARALRSTGHRRSEPRPLRPADIRQQHGQQAEQWQESADLIDVIDARRVGEPAERRCPDPGHPER